MCVCVCMDCVCNSLKLEYIYSQPDSNYSLSQISFTILHFQAKLAHKRRLTITKARLSRKVVLETNYIYVGDERKLDFCYQSIERRIRKTKEFALALTIRRAAAHFS